VDCSTYSFTRNPNIHDLNIGSNLNPVMFTTSPDDKYLYVISLGVIAIPDLTRPNGVIYRLGLTDSSAELIDTVQSTYFISCSSDGKYLISCRCDSAMAPYIRMSLSSTNLQTLQEKEIKLRDSLNLWGAIALPGDTLVIGPAYNIMKRQWGFNCVNLNTGQDSLLCICGISSAGFFDVSPDGRYIVYVDTNNNAILHDIVTGDDRALGFTASWLRFSPDGTQIATFGYFYNIATGQGKVLNMDTGSLTTAVTCLTWEHNANNIIFNEEINSSTPLNFSLYILQL
jgi:hypothetical protein